MLQLLQFLKENQQGGKIPPGPHPPQPRLELKLCNTKKFNFASSIETFQEITIICETKYLNKKFQYFAKYLDAKFVCKIIQEAFHPWRNSVLMFSFHHCNKKKKNIF